MKIEKKQETIQYNINKETLRISIGEAIENLQNLKKVYEDKYEKLYLWASYDWDDNIEISLNGERWETEEEASKRLKDEKEIDDQKSRFNKKMDMRALNELKIKYPEEFKSDS